MTTESYADDFFQTPGVTYLNCAYHGALPRAAEEAARAGLELKKRPYLIRDGYHFSFPDDYRAAAARLVGVAAEDVAVTDSTTHAMMLLVNGLPWSAGDEIVLPQGEFPANLFPWRSLEARGVVVRQLELPSAEQVPERIAAALTERTRLVSVSWVSYSTGRRLDLRAIGEVCRERGVLFAVDGSQGVGGLEYDFAQAPCDLLACSGYKWLLGPYGLGFAYVDPELGERLAPANVNWFAIRGARDFSRLSECEPEFEPGARRFDVNETASFTNLAAGTAALRYLLDVTPRAVERHNRGLLDALVEGLPAGFRTISDLDPAYRSNIVCVAGPSAAETERAYRRLSEEGVVVSHREGALRVSPHLFNTEDDVGRLVDGLSGRRPAAPALRVGDPVEPHEFLEPVRRLQEGRFVSLRPVDPEADVDDLFAVGAGDADRDRIWTYMHSGPFSDRGQMLEWLVECARSEDPLYFTVLDNATGRGLGMASYMNVVPRMRTLELGSIWYGLEAQRTRVNTETVYLMLAESFDRLGYRRVEWKCDALNHRSRRAAVRLGFEPEGVFRQHMVIRGRNRDTAWFAMLDRDWAENRVRLESWLYSESPGRLSESAPFAP